MLAPHKAFIAVVVGLTLLLSGLLGGITLKDKCTDVSVGFSALHMKSLCNATNQYESTLEIRSSCPATIHVTSVLLSLYVGAHEVVQTTLSGFSLKPGNNSITVDSSFTLAGGEDDFAEVRAALQQMLDGVPVYASASGSVTAEVLGITFNNVHFSQDMGCINCNSSSSPSSPSYPSSYSSSQYSRVKIASVEKADAVNDLFSSSFHISVSGLPLENISVSLPEMYFDVYENTSYIGGVNVQPVLFGNGTTSHFPFSTLLSQSEIARIARQTLAQHSPNAKLDIYGSSSISQCDTQKIISKVKLTYMPIPQYSMQDIANMIGYPDVSIADLVEHATVNLRLPINLDVNFTLFSLPDMAFVAKAYPLITNNIADLLIQNFKLTPTQLTLDIVVDTINPKLLKRLASAIVSNEAFPVDISWTVGNHSIFDLVALNLQINYDAVGNVASRFINSGDFKFVQPQAYAVGSTYTASTGIEIPWYYYYTRPVTLINTGSLPLYYDGEQFGYANLQASQYKDTLQLQASVQLTDTGHKVVSQMYRDLRNNRLPPGILLLAPGNQKYSIGKVIDAITYYFEWDTHLNLNGPIYFSNFGTVNVFHTGRSGNSVWLTTALTASDGLVSTLQLDKFSIDMNTGTISAKLFDNVMVSGYLGTSFHSPVFLAQVSLKWNQTNH